MPARPSKVEIRRQIEIMKACAIGYLAAGEISRAERFLEAIALADEEIQFMEAKGRSLAAAYANNSPEHLAKMRAARKQRPKERSR
jgi:hypothetical protein